MKKFKALGFYEPDVTWTDFLITVQSLYYVVKLYDVAFQNLVDFSQMMMFFAIACASLVGGLSHGLFEKEEGLVYERVWKTTLSLLVLTGSFILLCALSILNSGQTFSEKFLVGGVSLYAILGLGIVLFQSQKFLVALAFYVPPTLLLLGSLAWQFWTEGGSPIVGIGIIGLVLTLVAGLVQFLGVSLHKKYFNHNALYHLIQIIGLYFIYAWARGF